VSNSGPRLVYPYAVLRRIAPYLLLGLLTLGAGLGVGLGLASGPVTYMASHPETSGSWSCITILSSSEETEVDCVPRGQTAGPLLAHGPGSSFASLPNGAGGAEVQSFFIAGKTIPKGYASCLTEALNRPWSRKHLVNQQGVAFVHAMRSTMSECEEQSVSS
jgi:hypothetical protein